MVKQDCFEDLYCCNPDDDPDTKVRSTIHRIGQASLFTKYNADFYIVKEEKDAECQSWRQGKVLDWQEETMKTLAISKPMESLAICT